MLTYSNDGCIQPFLLSTPLSYQTQFTATEFLFPVLLHPHALSPCLCQSTKVAHQALMENPARQRVAAPTILQSFPVSTRDALLTSRNAIKHESTLYPVDPPLIIPSGMNGMFADLSTLVPATSQRTAPLTHSTRLCASGTYSSGHPHPAGSAGAAAKSGLAALAPG